MVEIILIVVLSVALVVVFSKYSKLKKYINGLKTELSSLESKKRIGYYTQKCTQGKHYKFKGIITVKEIDRYSNGTSKIELKNIELTGITSDGLNQSSAIQYLKSDFSTLMKTDEIEWLDSVEDIKTERKLKIEKLRTVLKNN